MAPTEPTESRVRATRSLEIEEEIEDTRPIWPGRPEVIYANYLTTKEAWLSTHPIIRRSEYRRAAGLKNWGRRYCQEESMRMPMDRLDLRTGKWVWQRVNRWSNEEIEAYLDYQA